MDEHLASYVMRYYRRFMTAKERLAHAHLFATEKLGHDGAHVIAQKHAGKSRHPAHRLLSDDPEVLELVQGGTSKFLLRTAERICAAHQDEIHVNRCPRCGEVAKTPKAKQCRFCKHDWHDS
jgi:hypothetical protein